MTQFDVLLHEADSGIRLGPKQHFYQTESSILRLYLTLDTARAAGNDLNFDTIQPLIAELPFKKQAKYSKAIKFVIKTMTNQNSNIFATLRNYSEKLSKSQQRYSTPLLQGDVGHGLCGQMALLWLKAQFSFWPVSWSFPRLANGNVVGSKKAHELAETAHTKRQEGLAAVTGGNAIECQARVVGLTAARLPWRINFERFQGSYEGHPEVSAFFIRFANNQHAIAIFRENAQFCQFYDANAGSYRIATSRITDFLTNYNNVCLPQKWNGYNTPANEEFSEIYSVART